MNNKIKTSIIILLAIVVVGAVVLNITNNKKQAIKIEDKSNTIIEVKEPVIEEQQIVEQYVRDNIGKIATNKPVLGGVWYVISVNINSLTKIGEITYEDGHIQSKATFSYVYNKDTKSVQITKFTVNK